MDTGTDTHVLQGNWFLQLCRPAQPPGLQTIRNQASTIPVNIDSLDTMKTALSLGFPALISTNEHAMAVTSCHKKDCLDNGKKKRFGGEYRKRNLIT